MNYNKCLKDNRSEGIMRTFYRETWFILREGGRGGRFQEKTSCKKEKHLF
jgi:hypothetical protein